MTLAVALAANAVLAVALLCLLAYVMSVPRRLAPRVAFDLVRRPPVRRRSAERLRASYTPVSVG
jgi:hypothetical protein